MTVLKEKFYAVKVGRLKGIYTTWNSCKEQVDGYVGSKYKSFKNRLDAENYLNNVQSINNLSSSINDLKNNELNFDDSNIVSVEPIKAIKPIKSTKKYNHNPDNDTFLVDYTYIFCDGSAKQHSDSENSSGFGVCLLNKEPKTSIIYGTKIGNDSNIKGELKAIIYSLELIGTLPQKNFIIVTDSEYSLNSILVWNISKTSSGKERMHLDLIGKCKMLIKELGFKGKKILFKHIMSHKKQPDDTSSYQYFLWFGNKLADDVAGIGKSVLSKNTSKLTYPSIWNKTSQSIN
uniref:Ribonuclease H n=1 Tax=viral metagenome TaxID=1070528 RepID=A0A6C0EA56_9ZZZZ